MSRRFQQIVSCFVALCVMFAGAIGLSPTLHWWMEHGGDGHAHSHAVFHTGGNVGRQHPHSHPHPDAGLRSDDALAQLLAEKYPQPKLFGLDLKEVYCAIGSWVARTCENLPESPSGGDNEGHTHHSLAQMLLNGTVEGISDVPPLVCAPTALTLSANASVLFVASELDALSASRAPPARS